MKTVGIQGIKGSYHDQVAKDYFGKSFFLNEFLSFDDLALSVSKGKSEFGVMAIENSIAGSIIPNYALIDSFNLNIVGEYFININHQLMVLPGSKIKDIKYVSSHPMALLQCKDFFIKHPHITLVEEKDTAGVAKLISKNKIKDTAAIASIQAAKMYGLDIVSKNIQTIKKNQTRFVIVSKNKIEKGEMLNKASLKFSLSHETGSLAAVLNILKQYNLNLTKIQSLPIIEIPWKYSFFVDTTFISLDDFNNAVNIIKNQAESFKILGVYKNKMK
ncbi:MAG: prephenate dehydratase [Flavobacteriaceae bacterium]|nr:prephenate dehydratase [Flavobacteriaceae bacterium]